MLELQEMIRVLHVVPYSIVFILFYGQGWQGGVFKVMKNDFFFIYIFTCFGLLPQVFE